MHVRFAFLMVLGLLAIQCVTAQSSSTDTPSTVTTDAQSSNAPTSTSQPGASSASPDPSATTQSPAPQPSGATSQSPASGATSQSPGPQPSGATSPVEASTVGGSTVSSGPTTPAPLPNVTVSILQFSQATCDDSLCTYSIAAPGNDQVFLATEDSLIATDRSQFSGLQAQAASKDSAIVAANKAAQEKINQLQALLDNIQSNLNSIQNNIATIQNQQTDATATLQFVQKFINDINGAPDTCLYQRCLKPTTPAPPTTTPTPAPTTPPSPCVNFTCPDDVDGSAHCKLDSYNKPSCDNCMNNFDGYNHCNTVTCNSVGSGLIIDSATQNGVLYSTGYNQTDPASSVIPAGANCRWNTNGSYQVETTTDKYNMSCLSSNSVVMFVAGADGFNQQLTSGLTIRSLNKVLQKIDNPTFTLTSTNSVPTFCSIPLTLQPPPTSGTFVVEQKTNGFFSWLMGY